MITKIDVPLINEAGIFLQYFIQALRFLSVT